MRTKKPFEDLTFADDFMFGHVLENNPDLCRDLVQVILGRPISKITGLQKQHVVDSAYNSRGVRFDVHFQDEESKVYSVEMQAWDQRNLPKRMRFYSNSMDQEQLDKGSKIEELKDTYVIFICTYNISKERSLARYTFHRRCDEDLAYTLEDGTHLIVVCAENNDKTISEDLKNLLCYVSTGKMSDPLTQRLEEHVSLGRRTKEWRREYMLFAEYLDEAKAEGITMGKTESRIELNTLNAALLKDGRIDDLKQSLTDPDFQEKLLQEYGLLNKAK